MNSSKLSLPGLTFELTWFDIIGITFLVDYKQTLLEAQERLKTLVSQRDALDREIDGLSRIIEGAQIGAQEPSNWDPDNPAWIPKKINETEPTGVTDGIRKVLARTSAALLPTEIRDALETIGIEGSSSKNLLIHVHKALGRMFNKDEVAQIPRDGKMAYRLMSLMERTMRQIIEQNAVYKSGMRGDEKPKEGLPPPPKTK